MSNLNQPQSEWNKLFRELGVFIAPIKQLRDVERKFSFDRNRIQVVEFLGGFAAQFSNLTFAWSLSGLVTPTATDESGNIYVRVTVATGNATFSLYNAKGGAGGALVAQSPVVAIATPAGSYALTAQNSSGLTGTLTITGAGTITAQEISDTHYLQAFVDWPLRARGIFDNSKPEHAGESKAFYTACDGSRNGIRAAIAAWTVALTTFLSSRFSDFMNSSAATAPISRATKNVSGLVTTVYTGVLEDARKDMVDEANAGAQKVLTNTITPSAPVFDTQNQGLGAMATPTMAQWAQDGQITLVCVDATVGSEKFQVTQRLTTTNQVISAFNNLQVKQAYADPVLGIQSMLLTRTLSFTAGGASTDFGAASSWVVNGETPSNTSNGSIFCKITASGGGSVTSKIAIGAGAASTIFQYNYKNGTTRTVSMGGGATTATLVAAALNADPNFSPGFLASATDSSGGNTGSTFLTIALKSTADGEYGLIMSGTLNGQGGTGQDTFTNNTTIGQFRIDGFTSSLLTTATQVFTSSNGKIGTTVALSGSAGITGTAVIGTQPISGDTATLALNCFQTQNANNVPDKITVQITASNASRGEFQDRLAELFGYGLNSAASGSQTLNEGYVTCGTFPPYSVRDA